MNRPLHIWITFALCAAILMGAVSWVTATALRLEHAQADAQQQADFEEKVRLALWRMDSLLTPMIVEESARPAAHYKSFYSAGPIATKGGVMASDVMIPSPLLTYRPTRVRLYFEVAANGTVTSPEVGFGDTRAALARYTTTQHIEVATARLAELKQLLAEPAIGSARRESNSSSMLVKNNDVLLNAALSPTTNVPADWRTNALAAGGQQAEQRAQVPQQLLNVKAAEIVEQQSKMQSFRNSAEYQARVNVQQQVAQGGGPPGYGQQAVPMISEVQKATSLPEVAKGMREGPMTPVWIGSALMLVRRVNANEGTLIQGAWLNWDELQQTLLANIQDLFPQADLRPALDAGAIQGGRNLAAIPAEFVPNSQGGGSSLSWTPVRFTLVIAWAGILLAAVAVGLLLHGAVSLSERRGAFVSAVTHEMRTPLTTFKMYSEMLAEEMVSDEAKRKHYLNTLCSEANRLSHLVENVLAYARLERGSARSRVERVTLGSLIERILPRLRERTERAEMELTVDAEQTTLATVVHVDTAAVEQILFNLVDNACKYAGPQAGEKRIHLEALPDGKFAMLRVRDHGQGISADGAKRLFKPFSKSAEEAAQSAPGIGLGLALCRRLSRSIGGDLRLVDTAGGACFELRLPLGASGDAAALSSI